MKTVMITGSRTWLDVAKLEQALEKCYTRFGPFILMHGCAKGADLQADNWATHKPGMKIRRFPARWDEFGKRAGYIRNADMVAQGANLCLAFIRNESKGATMAAELAQKAGITTLVFRSN